MASYKGHVRSNLFVLGAGVGLLATRFSPAEVSLGAIGFLWATFFYGPDVDLYNSRPSRNWGLARILLWPYSFLVSHRSMISHSVIWGTPLRLLYLSFVLIVLLVAGGFLLQQILGTDLMDLYQLMRQHCLNPIHSFLVSEYGMMLIWFVGGVWLSDTCHIGLDRISSAWKKV